MHNARHRVQSRDARNTGSAEGPDDHEPPLPVPLASSTAAPLTTTVLTTTAPAAVPPGIAQLGTARSTWPMDRQAAATFPGVPESVATARRFVRITAAMWRLPGDTLADAELCMSELVCNAVTHTCSRRVHCRLWSARGVLFVEVDDEDRRDLPQLERADDEDEHGRGMLLVDTFATAWGAVPRPGCGGKTVWAALNLPRS
ncbi:anti-sigma regulatory factor (Ser/Thr protein kinase) [Streptacidiphilus sp. MAP12-16]|jgi:anti-sigma regulatory factor (Ser/Thr protein kinase)